MAGCGRIASISIMTESATSTSMTLLVVMAWPCSSNPARTDAAFNQHQWGLPLPCLPACALGPKRASRKTPKGGDDMAFYSCRGFPTGCFGGGPWHNVHNRYLGLKFLIHGKPHYGWARLNLNVNGMKLSATLTGYAYETIPNKAIITGKTKGPDEEPAANETPDASVTAPTHAPATLGALALGAPGLSIWRRVELADAPR